MLIPEALFLVVPSEPSFCWPQRSLPLGQHTPAGPLLYHLLVALHARCPNLSHLWSARGRGSRVWSRGVCGVPGAGLSWRHWKREPREAGWPTGRGRRIHLSLTQVCLHARISHFSCSPNKAQDPLCFPAALGLRTCPAPPNFCVDASNPKSGLALAFQALY